MSFIVAGRASAKRITQGHLTLPDGTSIAFACEPFGPGLSTSQGPCPACVPAGDLCGGTEGPCCEGLTCSGAINQPPRCH